MSDDVVLAQLEQLRAIVADGFARVAAQPTPAGPPPPLRELADAYLLSTKRRRADLTYEQRASRLELFLAWCAARDVTIATGLTRRLLDDYDEHLRVAGHRRPCSEASRRQILPLILRWWWWARDREEWAGRVPTPPRSLELPVAVPASVHAATWAQADDVLARLRSGKVLRAATIQRCLGWRVRQVCRLRERDFDFARDTITLPGRLGKTRREKRGRVCPFPPALKAVMLTWWLRSPDAYIVPRSRPRKAGVTALRTTIGVVRRAIRKAWRASGAPEEIWKQRPDHAFRKCVTSELRHVGVPKDAIEYWCGRTTGGEADTYTDPRCLELQKIAAAIPPIPGASSGAPLLTYMLPRSP